MKANTLPKTIYEICQGFKLIFADPKYSSYFTIPLPVEIAKIID